MPMRQRLFPNIKRMTTMFCAGIVLITMTTLASRLTFLSGMAVSTPDGIVRGSTEKEEKPGEAEADYLINSRIYFSAPDAKGNILVTNTEHNKNYIRVDLILDETGRSIYYSGDIAPGASIATARLQSGPQEEGIYPCTAVIAAYDPESWDKIGEEKVPVSVYIGVKPDKAG